MEYNIITLFLNSNINESLKILNNLKLQNISLDDPDESGKTLLQYTFNRSRIDLTEAILRCDGNPDLTDEDNETILLKAARSGNFEFVKLLMAYGANPEIYDNNGDSAVLWASYYGYIDIVIFLIENGADPHHTYCDNRDALMWATRRGKEIIVIYLSKFFINISRIDKNGNDIIQLACPSIKKILLDIIMLNKLALINKFNHLIIDNKEYQLIDLIFSFYYFGE